MARRADAGAVDMLHAFGAALLDNFCREIDFVMRRTNARAELHNQFGRVRSEPFPHLLYRFWDNRELGPIFSGMDETDGRRFWINNVNRATIGDVNPERDFSLIRDDAVTAREFFVARRWNIDNRNFITVNLFCS